MSTDAGSGGVALAPAATVDAVTDLDALVKRQSGIVSRPQCLHNGVTDKAIDWRLRSGRWRQVHPGVYITHLGPETYAASLWAAVLAAGEGATVSDASAGVLWGLARPSRPLCLAIPAHRRIAPLDGVAVRRSRWLSPVVHRATRLPCTSAEETVLDLAVATPNPEAAAAVVADAVRERVTSTSRLQAALALRRKVRWRSELERAIGDVGAGAHSALELAYLRRVERRHGLPEGTRQILSWVDGNPARLDVLYDAYATVVELDGVVGHAGPRERHRDMRRDNASTTLGRASLRYGWHDVDRRSCEVAGQVAQVLHARGWTGRPRRCGPKCSL